MHNWTSPHKQNYLAQNVSSAFFPNGKKSQVLEEGQRKAIRSAQHPGRSRATSPPPGSDSTPLEAELQGGRGQALGK